MPQSERGTWKNKADFVLALISYGVGLGNVWRFPYLAYSSGGGAFLIPFLVSSIAVGIPYALLEVSLGQWMKEGGIGAWDLVPLWKGIGFASLIIVFLQNVYYEVILAWSLRYLFDSFSRDLPWKYCSNKWNTPCCNQDLLHGNTLVSMKNLTFPKNVSIFSNCSKTSDPITEYWERNVLGISSGIDELGGIKWDLFLALLIAWIIVYFSIFRGMKNSPIVVYITAVMPYIFLFILLIRSVFLPGAMEGIIFYLKPDWEKLTKFQVWSDAGTQVFYSYGIGVAALVALVVNTFTSILSGFVIFSVLGYMAHIQNVKIEDVAEEGPGLAFIVYPQALSLMPFSPVWSIMFFLMLFLLGLGTQTVAAEAITTAIIDEYMPVVKKYIDLKHTKELLSLINVVLSFICGIPMITNGGMYIFQIFDYYAASRTLIFVGLFECIAISYFYGVQKYCRNLELMWKCKLGPFLSFMWSIGTPFFTMILIVFTIMTYEDLTYNRTYKFPKWALIFGWILSISSIICIPIYAIYKFIATRGSVVERFRKLRMTRLKSHQIGIGNREPLSKGSDDIEEAENDSALNNNNINNINENRICEINESQLKILASSSISDDESGSVFVNSRTK